MKYLGKTVFTYGVKCCRDLFMFAMMDTEGNGIRHYRVDRTANQLDKVVSSLMCDGVCWITYNGQYYDSTILNYIIANYKELSAKSPSECAYLIYSFSLTVWNSPVQEWAAYKNANKFLSVDLSPMFYNRGFVTFGEAKARLGYDDVRVREVDNKLSIGSRRSLMSKYLDLDLKEYADMAEDMTGELNFREFLLDEYNLNVLNSTPSKLAFKVFSMFYEAKCGKLLDGDGVRRYKVEMAKYVPDMDTFEDCMDKEAYEAIRGIVVTSEDSSVDIAVPSIKARLTMAGLKGFSGKGVYKGGNGSHIYMADISSAWPSVSLKYGIVPEGIDREGYTYAMNMLMSLKRRTGYVRFFKNVMNAIIGMFGVNESPLHDYEAFLAVRILSALETICMIRRLSDAFGIDIIQVNNDGVVFSCGATYESVRSELDDWESFRRLDASLDKYDLFAQHSLNDWFASNGGVFFKRKGMFENGNSKYSKGICDAVAKAIMEDISVDNALTAVPKRRLMEVKTLSDGEEFAIKEEDVYIRLGNIIRCYRSFKPKDVYRYDPKRGGYFIFDANIGLSTDRNVSVDYKWYAIKAYQLYTELTQKQLQIF